MSSGNELIILKKERRESFEEQLLPADIKQKKMSIKEIKPKLKRKPKAPITYTVDMNDLINKKNISKPQIYLKSKPPSMTYTLNMNDIKGTKSNYGIHYKNKDEYEFDIESQNEHIHGNHYLDKKGIVNETISFDDEKPKIPPRPKRPKRRVPKPPVEPPLYTSEYRKEIHRLSSKKSGNVLKKIKAIELLKKK